MIETTKTIELTYTTALGGTAKITLDNPKVNLTAVATQEAMTDIKELSLFQKDGAPLYNEIVGARYVVRSVEDIF